MTRLLNARISVGILTSGALALATLGTGSAVAAPPAAASLQASSSQLVDLTPLTGRQPLSSTAVHAASDVTAQHGHYVTVRTEFGLRHDDEWLTTVDQDSTATTTELGVPLTQAESAEVAARQVLNKYNGLVLAAGLESPYFGGVEIDQAAGGVINLKLVQDTQGSAGSEALKSALLGLLPASVKSKITYVPYSSAVLQTAYDTVVADLAAGRLSSLHITSVGQEGETLTITTSDASGSDSETTLRQKYTWPFARVIAGTGVDFQTGRNHTSGILYGGEWIVSSLDHQCTSGYSHAVGGSNGTSYYEITAGHCQSPGYSWHQGLIYAAGNYFGTGTVNNGAYTGTTSKCDCQSIGPVPAAAATTRVYTSYTDTYAYTGLPTNTNDSGGYGLGRKVCVSGAASAEDYYNGGIACGTIQSQNFSETTPGGVYVTNLITTSITNNEQGDSGAPVGSGGDFMGIHSGRENYSPYHGLFSRSVYIASVTGATPRF